MKKENTPIGNSNPFHVRSEGIECWSARELQPLLGYAQMG